MTDYQNYQRIIEIAIKGNADKFELRVLLLKLPEGDIAKLKNMKFKTLDDIIKSDDWRYDCIIDCLRLMEKPDHGLACAIERCDHNTLLRYLGEQKEQKEELESRLLATVSSLNKWPSHNGTSWEVIERRWVKRIRKPSIP